MEEFELTAPEPKDTRSEEFKDLIFRGYRWACENVWHIPIVEPGWDMRDGAQLKRYLAANPEEEIILFGQTLHNYFRSLDHSSGERPFRFLPRLDCYRVKPQNVFRRDQDAQIDTAQTQRQRRSSDAFERARRDRQLPERYVAHLAGERIELRRDRTLAPGFRPVPDKSD